MIDLKLLDKFYIDDFVKDIFIGMLQQLFFQNPGEFHYDPEETLSRINITDQFSYDNLTPEFKPSIYIRRRPLGFMNTSIDQLVGYSFNNNAKRYSDLLTGLVELVAVSREGLEAARLASITFLLINEFVGELRRLGMHDVSVKSLGEEELKDVRSTMRVVEVPVTVQYTFQYSWMMQTMNQTALGSIEAGRSSDPVTGETYVSALKDPSVDGAGGDGMTGDGCDGKGTTCPTCDNGDGTVKICIPFSSDSPKNPK